MDRVRSPSLPEKKAGRTPGSPPLSGLKATFYFGSSQPPLRTSRRTFRVSSFATVAPLAQAIARAPRKMSRPVIVRRAKPFSCAAFSIRSFVAMTAWQVGVRSLIGTELTLPDLQDGLPRRTTYFPSIREVTAYPMRSDAYEPGLGGKTMVLLPFMNTRL